MKPLSSIASGVAPSATLAIDALAKQMKADGIDVVGFGAGEPDFDTPDNIKAAGIAAINDNQTRYTPSSGIVPLKEAICKRLFEDTGVSYKAENICVASGAKHSVYVTMRAILDPGDEVILPVPYWVTYDEVIKMCGGVSVFAYTDESTSFKLTPDLLKSLITPRTKCLIINNPSNPTGMLYTREELEAIAKVAVDADLYILSDEIYYALTYRGEFVSMASLSEEIKEHTIIVNGVSKSYAMTGWRVGYTAANPQITKVMGNYLSHSTAAPSTISQYASVEALAGDQSAIETMRSAFDERRRYIVDRINSIDGVSCLDPDGAFYVFMNIKQLLGSTLYGKKIETSDDFAQSLLENGLVAVVPGNAFGAEGYVRWSYATSMENIIKGMDRLEKFLKEGK